MKKSKAKKLKARLKTLERVVGNLDSEFVVHREDVREEFGSLFKWADDQDAWNKVVQGAINKHEATGDRNGMLISATAAAFAKYIEADAEFQTALVGELEKLADAHNHNAELLGHVQNVVDALLRPILGLDMDEPLHPWDRDGYTDDEHVPGRHEYSEPLDLVGDEPMDPDVAEGYGQHIGTPMTNVADEAVLTGASTTGE